MGFDSSDYDAGSAGAFLAVGIIMILAHFIFKDVALIYGFLAITLSLWGYLRAFILLRKELKNE